MSKWYQTLTNNICRITFTKHLVKKYHVHFNSKAAEPQQPFVTLSNYSSIYDPYLVSYGIKTPLGYLVNFDNYKKRWSLPDELRGFYTKERGTKDVAAIQKTISKLGQSHSLFITPEEEICWDGERVASGNQIGKLIKKLDIPVRLAHVSGGYLSYPRWAETPRKGRILIEYDTLDRREINFLTPAGINAHINKVLYTNDVKNSANKELIFSGKNLAWGIHRLLWRCPHCREIDSLSGLGNNVFCSACKESWTIDGNQRLLKNLTIDGKTIFDLKDLSDWQKRTLPTLLDERDGNPIFSDEIIFSKQSLCKKQGRFQKGKINLYRSHIKVIQANSENVININYKEFNYFADYQNRTCVMGYQENGNLEKIFMKLNGKNVLKYITASHYLKGCEKR